MSENPKDCAFAGDGKHALGPASTFVRADGGLDMIFGCTNGRCPLEVSVDVPPEEVARQKGKS